MNTAYQPTERQYQLMRLANELALNCPKSDTAFAVGAVLADSEGTILAQGYSRELGPRWHAEQVAFHKAAEAGMKPQGADIFVSLEPCFLRSAKTTSCSLLIVEHGIRQVFYSQREPEIFVKQQGIAELERRGIPCHFIAGFEAMFRAANAHLLG